MSTRGFTLIETLVAVMILSLALIGPMALVARSVATSFYSRDQVVAFFLAQEALESIRNARDNNILSNAYGTPTSLLAGFPAIDNSPFVIDSRDNLMISCQGGVCPPLKTDGVFYAYGPTGTTQIYSAQTGWSPTRFTRTVRAQYVKKPDGIDNTDQIKVTVTITWRSSGAVPTKTVTLSEEFYKWIPNNALQ
ncbi:prepilin-type N-terminal cleavage/methylation domain-containing protein [bacterium]|nr:prepilin-type N-terminal cleavage/methylation domain-containing protein [bacterium]